MLMFENGILVSFIPEIFMVIGFLFYLFAPVNHSTNTTADINPQILCYNSTEQVQDNKTYIVSTFQFRKVTQDKILEKLPIVVVSSIIKSHNKCSEVHFKTSDSLSFVQFSRPPPFCC